MKALEPSSLYACVSCSNCFSEFNVRLADFKRGSGVECPTCSNVVPLTLEKLQFENHIYEDISPDAFMHPLDKIAIAALRKVPGLDIAIRMMMEYSYEKIRRVNAMADDVKVTSRTCSYLHDMAVQSAKSLGIAVPDVYINQDPFPNAYTLGTEFPLVTLHSGLIELLNEDELYAVIAHEMGHIKCHHVLYHMLAGFITDAASALGIAGKIILTLNLALLEWSRKSELSADRAALLVTNNRDAVVKTLMKLAGGSWHIAEMIDEDEFVSQGAQFEELTKGIGLNKLYRFSANIARTHPFPVLRGYEISKWAKTAEYSNIVNGDYVRRSERQLGALAARRCPQCGQAMVENEIYCEACGQGAERLANQFGRGGTNEFVASIEEGLDWIAKQWQNYGRSAHGVDSTAELGISGAPTVWDAIEKMGKKIDGAVDGYWEKLKKEVDGFWEELKKEEELSEDTSRKDHKLPTIDQQAHANETRTQGVDIGNWSPSNWTQYGSRVSGNKEVLFGKFGPLSQTTAPATSKSCLICGAGYSPIVGGDQPLCRTCSENEEWRTTVEAWKRQEVGREELIKSGVKAFLTYGNVLIAPAIPERVLLDAQGWKGLDRREILAVVEHAPVGFQYNSMAITHDGIHFNDAESPRKVYWGTSSELRRFFMSFDALSGVELILYSHEKDPDEVRYSPGDGCIPAGKNSKQLFELLKALQYVLVDQSSSNQRLSTAQVERQPESRSVSHIRLGTGYRGKDLIEASRQGDTARVIGLVNSGADVAFTRDGGWTALMDASFHGHKWIVSLLLQSGADVNATNDENSTALHYAACMGRRAVVDLLLDQGADPRIRSKSGDTPLDEAKRKGHEEIVRIFDSHGLPG